MFWASIMHGVGNARISKSDEGPALVKLRPVEEQDIFKNLFK